MPITLEHPTIRLPEEFRAPILKKPDEIKTKEETNWTPNQLKLAEQLQDLFKGKDRFELSADPISRPIDDLKQQGIEVNPDTHTISYKNQTFKLPSALQIDPSTNTVRYVPTILGASPKVTASHMDAANKLPAGQAPLEPVPVAKPKPLTPAEQQAMVAQQQAQAAAAAAQRVAAQQVQANQERSAASNSPQKPASNSENNDTSLSNIAKTDAAIDLEEASKIVSNVSGMQQAIAGARNTQVSQQANARSVENAVQISAEQTVGSVIASKSAQNDSQQKNQDERNQQAFANEQSKNATSVVEPGKSAGPHKGKK